MSGTAPILPLIQFHNALGHPVASGTVNTYVAGSLTPTPTWQDEDLTILNTNPIQLDSSGQATIFLDPAVKYKFLLKNALGATVPGWPVDDITSLGALTAALSASSGAALIGFSHAQTYPAGSLGAKEKLVVNVKDAPYSAAWDGVTNDIAAVTAAIVAVNAAGGGVVQLPVGTGLIGASVGSTGIALLSNVTLRGAGIGATVVKLKNAADAHTINVANGTSNVGIEGFTIDGNRANQTLQVHGVRVVGVDGLRIADMEIKETFHYGIGVQDNTNKNIKIDNVDIHDTGGDGIDIKNKNDNNESFQISNVTVRRWGKNLTLTVQAGIDCRGVVQLSNIWISEPVEASANGLRFRQGEALDANGVGGHYSTVSNFSIEMGAGAAQIGLMCVAREVKAVNGRIKAGLRGVQVQASGFKAVNVTVHEADDGFLLDAGTADDCVLAGCTAFDCVDTGFGVETDNCQLIGCIAFGNQEGIQITATASNTRVLGGRVTGNSGSDYSSLGTDTYVAALIGIGTHIDTPAFAVKSAAGVDSLEIGAGTGAGVIGVRGATTNADVMTLGKGTGGARLRDGAGVDKVRINTTGIGFNAAPPLAKPAITGSRGGNVALASLLTQLANYGLITDSTTV